MSFGDVTAENVPPVPMKKKHVLLKKKKEQSKWIDHRRFLKSKGYYYSKYPLNDLVRGAYVYAGHRVVLYQSGYYCFRKVVMSIEELDY